MNKRSMSWVADRSIGAYRSRLQSRRAWPWRKSSTNELTKGWHTLPSAGQFGSGVGSNRRSWQRRAGGWPVAPPLTSIAISPDCPSRMNVEGWASTMLLARTAFSAPTLPASELVASFCADASRDASPSSATPRSLPRDFRSEEARRRRCAGFSRCKGRLLAYRKSQLSPTKTSISKFSLCWLHRH
ncbi:hypothetical protein ACVWY3_000236 [Bradyrhizobium sp. USDA 4486]